MTYYGSTQVLPPYSCPYSLLVPTRRDGHEWEKWARVRLAPSQRSLYRPLVVANSATGFGDPHKSRRISALTESGAFLCPAFGFMVAVRGRPSGLPGSLIPGSPTCVQLPP